MQAPIGPEGQATVKLDGSGTGTISVGPLTARETWQPQIASVSVATNVKEAACKIYVGPSRAAAYFLDGTLSGSTGDSTDRVSAAPCPHGYWVWAVWAGGDAGAVATLRVTGTKEL